MANIHPLKGYKQNIVVVCSQSNKLSTKSNPTTQSVLKCIAKALTRVVRGVPALTLQTVVPYGNVS